MTTNDDKVKKLLKNIEEKRAELGTKPTGTWKTCGIFKFKESGAHININVIGVDEMVDATTSMLIYEEMRKKACELLGVTYKKESIWNGYTSDEWIADFKIRAATIAWNTDRRKLEVLEAKLKSLVSEEAKTGMEIDSISKELGI